MVRLEVCVECLESAVKAAAAGAARLEVCANLAVGGTTPSAGLVGAVLEKVEVPVHVLIRSRPGDFCYDRDELAVMERDIRVYRTMGVHGFALGALNSDGTVDKVATARLMAAARPGHITFHRAFDAAADPLKALSDLIELGVDTLLSSGQAPSAVEGLTLLAQLARFGQGRIAVMPGAGIDRSNVARIARLTSASYVHGSARDRECSRRFRSDPAEVQAIVAELAGLGCKSTSSIV